MVGVNPPDLRGSLTQSCSSVAVQSWFLTSSLALAFFNWTSCLSVNKHLLSFLHYYDPSFAQKLILTQLLGTRNQIWEDNGDVLPWGTQFCKKNKMNEMGQQEETAFRESGNNSIYSIPYSLTLHLPCPRFLLLWVFNDWCGANITEVEKLCWLTHLPSLLYMPIKCMWRISFPKPIPSIPHTYPSMTKWLARGTKTF